LKDKRENWEVNFRDSVCLLANVRIKQFNKNLGYGLKMDFSCKLFDNFKSNDEFILGSSKLKLIWMWKIRHKF